MAYQPAGNLTTTSTLGHLATVWYDREALDVLRTKFMFWVLVDDKSLPKRNGKLVQFYRYTKFGANTTTKTEGQVGTSLQLTTNNVQATVSQYADFISFSDFLEETALDDIVSGGAQELGFRGGLTADNLVKTEADTAFGSAEITLLGANLAVKDLANARHILQGLDVQPKSGPYFPAIAHPHVTYDLLNDPQAGGHQDLVKHDTASQGNNRLFTFEDRGFVARIKGIELWESTNVTKTGSKWRTYIAGKQAIFAIDLAGEGPARVKDPRSERFNITVIRPGKSAADPEGVVSAYVSYNFKFVTKIADTNPYRFRMIDSASSIAT